MDCLLKVYEFLWNANSLKVLNYNTLSPKSMKYKFVYRSMLKVNLMQLQKTQKKRLPFKVNYRSTTKKCETSSKLAI